MIPSFLMQDQSSKLYHGFKVGHLLRLNEQTLSMVLLIFACAFWEQSNETFYVRILRTFIIS